MLTADDITRYHRIVIALHETIRLMAEIDRLVYDLHGLTPAELKLVEEATTE